MEKLCERINEGLIIKRSEAFHTYVIEDNKKIIAVGSVGPYWNSLCESSFFNIYVLPEYQGKGIGKLIVKTLENDEYYKRADRIEIPASITAVEFYKHMGYGFKKLGNITDDEGHYKMEKYPKISDNNVDLNQYNMRKFIDNDYHNYKNFIYNVQKDFCENAVLKFDDAFDNFIEKNKDNLYIIQLNGDDIGFYSGKVLDDDNYQIDNICIVPEYQGKEISTQVLNDIIELYKDKNIYIKFLQENFVGSLLSSQGFILDYLNDDSLLLVNQKEKCLEKTRKFK